MKKILVIIVVLSCFFSGASFSYAQIKTNYASTTVDTTGIERGKIESIKNTTNIENYSPEIKEETEEKIGFWKDLFYVLIVLIGIFVAR